jgi:hypothetical protein
MADEKKQEELLKRWKECLDEMAGTEYDCSFDCGSHQGEAGYCYHAKSFKEEEGKALKILEELLGASGGLQKSLQEAEKECRNPARQGWAMERGLGIIEKARREAKKGPG